MEMIRHRISEHKWLAISVGIGLVLSLGFFAFNQVGAHTDPITCDSTGVSLSLTVLRADGVTPVGAGSVTPGETIKYRATLSHAGGSNCNYEGGDLDIITPDGVNHDVDGGAIPLVDSGTPFVGSLVTYVVDAAHVGGDGDMDASTVYSGGTSHLGDGNVSPVGATTPASTPFVKLNPPIATQVHNASHADITNQSVAFGTAVHDNVAVTATSTGPTPTGTVDFTLQTGLVCDGSLVSTENNVALDGSGVAESSATSTLAVGDYSYFVHYDGDANYNTADASCEPFTIVEALEIRKTVNTSFDRTWEWTIDKRASSTELLLAEGEAPVTVNYEVEVSAISTDGNFTATGTITIINPNSTATSTITDVNDVVDGTSASVDCGVVFPFDLGPGDTLECTYEATEADGLDGTEDENFAEVITSGIIPGATTTVPFVFATEPTDEIDECVTVSDDNINFPGPVQICADDADKTIEYSVSFGNHPDADVIVECGETNHPNIARFVTNDTGAQGQDNWNVLITVECEVGCTLTQGYWRTHNDSFWGGAPTDDTWDLLGPDAEETEFFSSGMTWFEVFWTAPKGNAYFILAHQYMAAKLNILNGASTTPAVDAAIAGAEALFSAQGAGDTTLTKAERTAALGYAGTLGSYNEGLIGPGHCDEQNGI